VPDQRKTALIAGATGLVGGHLLDLLLDAPEIARVYAVTRRPLLRESPRLANRVVQFERIEELLRGLVCHVAFCCLGTTLRAAGSEQAFRTVDHDHVLAFARAAHAAGVHRFVVVSSVGADTRSASFYLRVKGETEAALAQVGFDSLEIMQPGLLLGVRRELRPLETLARLAMPLVNPLLRGTRQQYRGIPPRTVAEAMLGASRMGRRGIHRCTHAAMVSLAAVRPPSPGVPVPGPQPPGRSRAR
jgi:uncharacterized protein YbjT (DUF2867 family)